MGNCGVYMPYHMTWAHEKQVQIEEDNERLLRVAAPDEIPAALYRLKLVAETQAGAEAIP